MPIQIDEQHLQQRLKSLGFTDDDRRLLAGVWPQVEPHVETFLTQQHERFAATPAIAPLFAHHNRFEKLRQAQQEYLRELFCGAIDTACAQRQLNIGWVHHRLRVTPQWYLAAASHFMTAFIPILFDSADGFEQGMKSVVALTRRLIFDLGLALQSYGYYEDLSSISSAVRRDSTGAWTIDAPSATKSSPAKDDRSPRRSSSRLPLSTMETESRMNFIGITSDDISRIRSLDAIIEQAIPAVLQDFYDHFTNSDDLRTLVPPERVPALKQQVSTYWQELVRANFDRPYAASRMRIGLIHEAIGLEVPRYLTGLARQTTGFLRAIAANSTEPAAAATALIRAVFFDVTFVVDAYMEARAETLLHAEGLAGRVMKGLHSAVAVLDAEHRILYANEKLVALFGVEAAMLRMMRLEDALPLPQAAELFAGLQQNSEHRITRLIPWGTALYQATLTSQIQAGNSGRREFIFVLDDVSRLLQVSTDLQSDFDQHRRLTETVPAVLWQMDPSTGSLIHVSSTVEDVTGLQPTALLGTANAWRNYIHAEDQGRFDRCIDLLKHQKNASCLYRFQHPSGRELWLQTSLTVTADTISGREIYAAASVDVTRRQTAEHLRLRAMSQMAAGISHLLNNALTAVNCNIELHLAESGSADSAPLLDSALRASARAAEVTRQLQAFAGGQFLQPCSISLNQLLREHRTTIEELAGTRIRVTLNLMRGLWMCNVDADRLRTVIGNLCTNAQQAIAQTGELCISTRNIEADRLEPDDPGFGKSWVELSVTDDGSGMPDDIRNRAIEPFFSGRPLPEHAGLGLSIAHGFVTQSGGHMLIESEPETGTSVRLRFPRPAVPATMAQPEATTELTVLVVDDEPAVLYSTAAVVRHLGHHVLTAENSSEAMQLADAHPVDILLSDVSLKDGTDGIQLAHQMTQHHPEVAVILMSGLISPQTQSAIPEHWFCLNKPFRKEQIARTIERIRHPENFGSNLPDAHST